MIETGVIVSENGDYVKIQINKGDKCDGCNACHSFGTNLMQIEAENKIGAKIGDTVDFFVQPQKMLMSSFLLFIFPILMMIGGYFAGVHTSIGGERSGEGIGIMGSFLGLAVSLLIIKMYDKFLVKKHECSARVINYSNGSHQAGCHL